MIEDLETADDIERAIRKQATAKAFIANRRAHSGRRSFHGIATGLYAAHLGEP